MRLCEQGDIPIREIREQMSKRGSHDPTISREEALKRYIKQQDMILQDLPGVAWGIDVRFNIRRRICTSSDCPLKRALEKIGSEDGLEQIIRICQEKGMQSGSRYYGYLKGSEKLVYTADCAQSPHLKGSLFENYTSCGSLMATDLRIKLLPEDPHTLVLQSIRTDWVLNNFPATNPPEK